MTPRLARILLTLLVLAVPFAGASGASRFVRGIVRDSVSAEGLPFASVRTAGGRTEASTVADANGVFELTVPTDADSLRASCQGYSPRSVRLWTSSLDIYDISLPPAPTELRELVVGRQRYSKRNNPAVEFARRLREGKSDTDPTRRQWYSYGKYERITLGLNDFNAEEHKGMMRRFPFMTEHVDTSSLTGNPVLTLSVNEKASDVMYRRGTRREIVRGVRQRGVDEIVEQANMQTMLSDALKEVDLYDSDISLLRNSFVSPLSRVAPDFYRFYLVDTVAVGRDSCVVLAFYPRGHTGNGFAGHVYVAASDSAMNIRRLEMRTASNASLNFINNLTINQTYDIGPNGDRIKNTDELALDMTVLPGTPSIYVSRRISYRDHSFDAPADTAWFGAIGTVQVVDSASARTDEFWEAQLREPEPQGESRVDLLMSRLRAVPAYYWTELIVKRLFTGYWPTGRDSRFDIGPLNTLASYNALEGMRVRLGGMTTANLSPHWFGRGYVAYGFRDRKWKYSAEAEYSFNRKDYHSREFPVHSLRLRHKYDIDRIGARYLFTSPDNFVLSWTRMPARLDTYRRETVLEYTLELRNNFSLKASVENVRQEPGPFVPFTTFDGRSLGHYTQTSLSVELRYAPGEKFYQMRTGRFPINLDAPTFVLSHRWSPKGFLGSRYAISRTEFNFSKRFWMSFVGQMDVAVGAGHVWTSSPFPELLVPNANLSYTIQPQSFALMTPLEFVNTTYGSLHLVYHADGLLLNQIPGVRKLKLREIVSFHGLWGHRAAKDTPSAERPDLLLFPADAPARGFDHGPYMEMSAGLDNILRCLRVEYVWRLNYRHESYPIDRSGVRVALHVNF